MADTSFHITCHPNPQVGQDMLVQFSEELKLKTIGSAKLVLKYVPDREICATETFTTWLQETTGQDFPYIEAFAIHTLDYFYNQVMPAYVELALTFEANNLNQTIRMHRQQPLYQLSEGLLRELGK